MRRKWGFALLGLALAGAAFLAVTRHSAPPVSAEEALLARRVKGLQETIARGRQGPLLDFEQVLVVVHQDLVRDLLAAATPFESTVRDHYRVRIESASTEFSDGFALVRLEGRAEVIGQPVSADIRVLGGLEVTGRAKDSGQLRLNVNVFAVEAAKADILGVDKHARHLVEALARDGLTSLVPFLDLPLRVEDRVSIPALNSRRVTIPAAEIPFDAKVLEVRVFENRLWVSLGTSLENNASPSPAPQAGP